MRYSIRLPGGVVEIVAWRDGVEPWPRARPYGSIAEAFRAAKAIACWTRELP